MKTFEDMFEADFIRHLMEHDFKTKGEAQDVWNSCSEEYIEEMYQAMSDSIWHYTSAFENDKGEESFTKEVA